MEKINEYEKYKNSLGFIRLYKAFDIFFKLYNTTDIANIKFKIANALEIEYTALGLHVVQNWEYEQGSVNSKMDMLYDEYDNPMVDITLYYEGLTDVRNEVDFYSDGNKSLYEMHNQRVIDFEKSIEHKTYQEQVDEILNKLERINYVEI
jgi:hypothetical protein